MSTKTNTLAKSLHTVSVLVNVAKTMSDEPIKTKADATKRVRYALDVLGYLSADDPYELAARAVDVLVAGK